MSDGVGGAFRAAMTGATQPADTSADPGGQVDVFAGEGFSDPETPSEALERVVEGGEGRRATKEADPASDAMVPSWRLREISEERANERKAREAAERERDELRAYRQQQEEAARPKADLFDDPSQWESRVREEMKSEFQKELEAVREERRQEWGRAIDEELSDALSEKGQPFEDAARRFMEAFGKDPNLQAQWKGISPHRAVRFIENWDKRHSLMSEIGNDPAAYEAKLREKILAEMNGAGTDPQEAPAGPRLVTEGPQRAAPRAIPSLNRTASSREADAPQGGAATLRSALRGG